MTVRAFLQSSARASFIARASIPGFEWPQCHDDGTVTYWCPQRRGMMRRATGITPDALALLPEDEQARVSRHLWRALGARRDVA